MFSPDQFVHLVFADENDTYYGEDLLKLELNQYLWFQLHKEEYGRVYFLRYERGQLTLYTYGDETAQGFVPENKLIQIFKSRVDQFGGWMLQQLKAKREERTAFVCSLGDFCKATEGEGWRNVLEKMAKMERRTGILVLSAPVEDERARPLLLQSNVFEALGEKGLMHLREDTLRPMYESLDNLKPAVFLGKYKKSRIRAALLHSMLDGDEIYADDGQLDHMALYLSQYLNNPELRRRCPLLDIQMTGGRPRYQELYRWFLDRDTFARLKEVAEHAFLNGGLRSYLEQQGCAYVEEKDRPVFITRDRNGFAGRCLKLLPPKGFESPEICKLLEDIRLELLSPKNRKDNPKIAESVDKLLTKLGGVQSLGDAATYKRVLWAIRFCVQWLHVPENSIQEESVCSLCESMKIVIDCSSKCFQMEKQLGNLQMGNNSLAFHQRQALEYTFAAEKQQLQKLEQLVEENVAQLVVTDAAHGLEEVARRLQSQMEQCEAPEEDKPQPQPQPEPVVEVAPVDQEEEDLFVPEAFYADMKT